MLTDACETEKRKQIKCSQKSVKGEIPGNKIPREDCGNNTNKCSQKSVKIIQIKYLEKTV